MYLPLVKVTGLHVEQSSLRLLPSAFVSEDMGLYPPPPLNFDYTNYGGGWIREGVEGQYHSGAALQPDGIAFVLLVLAL